MAHVTDITVERNYTLNLGNYESLKLGASVTFHLSEGDDPDVVYAEGADFLDEKLMAEMEEITSDA